MDGWRYSGDQHLRHRRGSISLARRVALPGGIHAGQLDPEVESERPYTYANAFEFGTKAVFIVDIQIGEQSCHNSTSLVIVR